MTTLLVFSHLRWDFVYQRPQHLLSRLAGHYRILVVEEPVRDDGPAHIEVASVAPGVEVLRPHTPLAAPGFDDDQLAAIGPLLDEHLASRDIVPDVVWFYTPMALPLLDGLRPRAVVYDCMDELAAFLGAPPALREREAALLDRADLVLTGGPSLYEAKRAAGRHVLCLPSSVDARHFAPSAPASDDPLVAAAEALQASIPTPRLGFFGVIDERMDLALIDRLAATDPTWQIVMVGPVVKIDPASLPRRPNIHWLGQQSYPLLPCLVAGWQLCLLPFALNEATRFISPTKTLEYLAAEKPVVSTAVRDVESLYGDVVCIAADAEAFVDACARLLAEKADARRDRLTAAAGTVHRYSWDRTADVVAQAIDAVLDRPTVDSESAATRLAA